MVQIVIVPKLSKMVALSHGKQKYKCKGGGRQCVENLQKHPISEETQALIGQLLLETIPSAGIACVAEVSERWLQDHVNEKV